LLARTFNWTPSQIDDVELGFFYKVVKDFDKFPPFYMLFTSYSGYEAPSAVKWDEFNKKLNTQTEGDFNEFISAFGAMGGTVNL
jgi:hypothetical protein